jgi:hypothetical protein
MEWAWSWGRDQPGSALRGWCRERFGGGGKRVRRLGMVAVARTLRRALWRFLEPGVLPEGAGRKEASAVGHCCVTSGPRGWGRRPAECPGLPRQPSESWGRLR